MSSISLEKTLSAAQIDPESAQFNLILQLLDLAISSLSTTEQLKFAGDTIATVGQLYQLKAEILFSCLETTASDYEEDWQVSHEENFSVWQEQIDRYLRDLPRNTNKISLLQLASSSDLPLSILWLTLLLGEYTLEQTSDFYDIEGIWINIPLDK